MQTASTNICERLCNNSICEISLLLNIPRYTVSGIIKTWKQLGTTTQPRSGRPRKMTERGQRMLKRTVRRSCQWSAESIAKDLSKFHVAFRLAKQQCVESFMEWVSMAKQLHPSLISPSAMQSVGCSGVKHWPL
ncbi:unnamed protein product, partial [Staurois parvus]